MIGADPTAIGKPTSAGCVRMVNQDVIDLHDRVKPNAPILVMAPDTPLG